jgi:uncharacterized protein DUF6599
VLDAIVQETVGRGALAGLLAGLLAVGLIAWALTGVGVGVAIFRGVRLARRARRRVVPGRSAVICGALLWCAPIVLGSAFLCWPIEHAAPAHADMDPALAELLSPAPTPASRPHAQAGTLLARLPRQSRTTGWRLAAEPIYLPADRLHEKINGRDASFLAHGVIGMAHQRWIDPNDAQSTLDIEVYDMGAPAGAKAKYTEERPHASQSESVGQAGYAVASSVFARQGRYYLRIISGAEGTRCRQAALALARAVCAAVRAKP